MHKPTTKADLDAQRSDDGELTLLFSGHWTMTSRLPPPDVLDGEFASIGGVRTVRMRASDLADWDSSLLTFLLRLFERCKEKGIETDTEALPKGVRRLLDMATAVPEKKDARRKSEMGPLISSAGRRVIAVLDEGREILEFTGRATLAFGRMLLGRARFRRTDLFLMIQEAGPQALPIVTLISVLIGLILAFVGAIQLQMFGAEIYVADLVGLGMAREMAAMMCGVVMAGRTGAAYAAQLGTMQVNEEIDALATLGISPIEFLVLPRMTALCLMMPLLTLYANLMGILGGAFVAVNMLDLSAAAYFEETRIAVPLHHFAVGLIKSLAFGILVAFSGCLRGMQCGRSASAVGNAATSAVVTSIVLIIVFDAIFTVIFDIFNI